MGYGSHRGQGCQAWTAVGLPPRYPQHGVGHFKTKFGQEGGDDIIHILAQSRRDTGYRMQKKSCRYLLLFEHNAWTWQTDNRNRQNRLSAMSPKMRECDTLVFPNIFVVWKLSAHYRLHLARLNVLAVSCDDWTYWARKVGGQVSEGFIYYSSAKVSEENQGTYKFYITVPLESDTAERMHNWRNASSLGSGQQCRQTARTTGCVVQYNTMW